MCDPTPEKIRYREVAVPYVTYARHCQALHENGPTKNIGIHKTFLYELFELDISFPVDYYACSVYGRYIPLHSIGKMERYDVFEHMYNPFVVPSEHQNDCWVFLTIAEAVMITPWTGERYFEYSTVAMRVAAGYPEKPKNVNLDGFFPFKRPLVFEVAPNITQDGASYVPRISYGKCRKIAEYLSKSGGEYSMSWDMEILNMNENSDKYGLYRPYYASVIVEDTRLFEGLNNLK